MRVHVVFTPAEQAAAPVGIVFDVLRATSTIAQALASGYRRVLCCAELDDARRLRAEIPDSLVRGEDAAVLCAGFQGAFALDDAYCAGRIVQLLGADRSDAAIAADVLAAAYPTASD